uniref:Probable endolytic peptidoglycan transglycosylase RlpA n=3 Tax=Chlorobiaceae TaxID=191412 RepID=Q8RLW6_CHLLI|nr:rare lipoprotein A [Chlorobium limicola]
MSASPSSALASQNGAINHTISQKSSSSRSTAKPRPNADRFMVAVGKASYYATRFHGRTTANGETFDMKEFTAAHRSLPFGTIVRVTNLNNGKMVFVKINDRGPFKKNRIIDLSKAAAKKLDLVDNGIGRVKIEAYN